MVSQKGRGLLKENRKLGGFVKGTPAAKNKTPKKPRPEFVGRKQRGARSGIPPWWQKTEHLPSLKDKPLALYSDSEILAMLKIDPLHAKAMAEAVRRKLCL